MFNPFTEIAADDSADAALVGQAKNGDRAALEKLILRHQAWIYNIAVRMVFQPHDAEEVTQEVLVKVITKLSTFKGESKFRTWLYRITANHVLNMRRRSAETQELTFTRPPCPSVRGWLPPRQGAYRVGKERTHVQSVRRGR